MPYPMPKTHMIMILLIFQGMIVKDSFQDDTKVRKFKALQVTDVESISRFID